MTNHRAATHAAKETGYHIRSALRHTLTTCTAVGFGHFSNQIKGQQRFNKADRRQHNTVGKNDPECFQRERNFRNRETGKPAFDRGQIAHTRHINVEADHNKRHNHNAQQWRGHTADNAWGKPDERHGQANKTEHHHQRQAGHPDHLTRCAHGLELAHLRQKNHDRKAVNETQHNRVRHHANELTKPEHTRQHLQNSHQNHGRKKILNTVNGNQ